MPTKKKTVEEITKANLAKTLRKIKTEVADKEELWLAMLEVLLPLVMMVDEPLDEAGIVRASLLTDVVIREYENRWGKCE
jgi:hypothetical protein